MSGATAQSTIPGPSGMEVHDHEPAARDVSRYPARTCLPGDYRLATIMLYYELYVVGAVSTLVLGDLHTCFNSSCAPGLREPVGAFGALLAGITDRFGRANLVVGGLLITGVFTRLHPPGRDQQVGVRHRDFVVGLVEGICLVATPALIRDFSPQDGPGHGDGLLDRRPGRRRQPDRRGRRQRHDPRRRHQRPRSRQYVICGIAGPRGLQGHSPDRAAGSSPPGCAISW